MISTGIGSSVCVVCVDVLGIGSKVRVGDEILKRALVVSGIGSRVAHGLGLLEWNCLRDRRKINLIM